MLIDAHCHLTGTYLPESEITPTLVRAQAQGVTGFIAVGTSLEDSHAVLDLTHTGPNIQASLGIHPHEAKTWDSDTSSKLESMLRDPSVRFVGETGLDYHYDLSPRDQQEEVFRQQIRLAKKIHKPLMIHTREAPGDTLRILKDEGAEEVQGIIHCFSEDLDFARKAVDLGFYLSFSGILTFKKAETIREVAQWVPEDRFLVETDAPFLAPAPHRGKPNEPGFVRFTAEALADLRGLSLHRLADITTRNLGTLCGWHPSVL